MESLIYLSAALAFITLILSVCSWIDRRKLDLYDQLSFDNSPRSVFVALNKIPLSLTGQINFEVRIIRRYCERYFKHVVDSVHTLDHCIEPISKIGEIFSALSFLKSEKKRNTLECLLTKTFVACFSEMELGGIYYLYLDKRMYSLAEGPDALEIEGEKRIFEHILQNGKETPQTGGFLDALENKISDYEAQPNHSSIQRAFLMGELVKIRARLGDNFNSRAKRLEI